MAAARRSTRSRFLYPVFPLAFLLAAYLARGWWLPPIGEFLVETDPLEKADAVVVLAGDFTGGRLRAAADLVIRGYAPVVLVSGPSGVFGQHECDLAIAYGVKAGFPASIFEAVPHDGWSTKAEASHFMGVLRNKGVKRYILVTSNFHTRRAGRIFRAAGPDLRVIVAAAPDSYFRPAEWWKDRESLKTAWTEWQKTLTGPLGL